MQTEQAIETAQASVEAPSGGTIYVVTADLVAETGRITWEYFFADKTMPPSFLDAIMNLPWGWAWRSDRRDDSVAFNLFESGKGMLMGGGWAGDGGEWDRTHPRRGAVLFSADDNGSV